MTELDTKVLPSAPFIHESFSSHEDPGGESEGRRKSRKNNGDRREGTNALDAQLRVVSLFLLVLKDFRHLADP